MKNHDKGKATNSPALLYNLKALWRCCIIPSFVRRMQRNILLRGWEKRRDADEIKGRVDYYCRLNGFTHLEGNGRLRSELTLGNTHSRYWFDLMRYLRAFPDRGKVALINGDTHANPDFPVLAKARRLDGKTDNCTLLNLDSRRHFLNVDDAVPFSEKEGVLFFRGDVDDKQNRRDFLSKWFGHPLFNLGDTSGRTDSPWKKERVGITGHFKYKYILALEGYDVASALQWIMASNCIPVMPRPTVEGWLMHGALKPGVHYIEIAPDFSDAAEKIEYYNLHPEEAEAISAASRLWAERFADPKRESIISYLVVDKFKSHVG